MRQLPSLFADFANGIFATLLAGYIAGVPFMWWHLVVGLLLAMSPDLDALPELLRRGRVGTSVENPHDHREGLHFPILFLITGLAIIYFDTFWGTLFLLATGLHFINDVYGTGWGIALFWPLSKRRYKFFGRRVNRSKAMLIHDGDWATLTHAERKLRLVVTWSSEELPEYAKRWGVDNWIEGAYYHLTWISAVEYALLAVALGWVIMVLI